MCAIPFLQSNPTSCWLRLIPPLHCSHPDYRFGQFGWQRNVMTIYGSLRQGFLKTSDWIFSQSNSWKKCWHHKKVEVCISKRRGCERKSDIRKRGVAERRRGCGESMMNHKFWKHFEGTYHQFSVSLWCPAIWCYGKAYITPRLTETTRSAHVSHCTYSIDLKILSFMFFYTCQYVTLTHSVSVSASCTEVLKKKDTVLSDCMLCNTPVLLKQQNGPLQENPAASARLK